MVAGNDRASTLIPDASVEASFQPGSYVAVEVAGRARSSSAATAPALFAPTTTSAVTVARVDRLLGVRRVPPGDPA